MPHLFLVFSVLSKTQEHHFQLIKEGYVGALSSVDILTFDHFKQHLLNKHEIEEIQLPPVISDVQKRKNKKTKEEKIQTHQLIFNQR